MDLKLTGKRALVTGSSAGIGRAIATKLAEEGADVFITGRNSAKAEAAAQQIRAQTGRTAGSIAADLSTDDGALVLASGVSAQLGTIDILVNNSGVYFDRGWWDTAPKDWADVYNQNVVSFVRMIQQFGPQMRHAGWGRIINISSGEAWQPYATMADYAATKAAIVNLTVSLAKEFASQGVTVNTVSPGIIVTESTESYFRKVARDRGWPLEWHEVERRVIANFLPNSTGRLGRPTDVANVVAFVASPLSDYINGANYRVDGGSTTAIN